MRELRFQFHDHSGPDGELRADRAASVAAALDGLIRRLTREAGSAAGPGRAGVAIERLGEVRLAGISSGSTRLLFHIGDAAALDIDPLGERVDGMFWGIAEGIAANERPGFVTPTIADATLRLLTALQQTARTVNIALGGRTPVHINTAQAHRQVWESGALDSTRATLAGRLEAVDLRSNRFRLVDDVGNRVELIDVHDAESAVSLVSHRVLADGLYIPAIGAGKARLESAHVRSYEPPDHLREALASVTPEMTGLSATMPRMREEFALTDAELDAFLAAIHE